MGEIRRGDGTVFRDDFVIFPASLGITYTDPAVTFKSGHNLYFVIAKQRSGTTAQIIGRRISASGTFLDFGFFLSLPDAAFEGRPDVATVTSGSICCVLAVWKQSNTIRGRHIEGDSFPEGPSFIITTVFTGLFSPGTTAPTPAVVYQPRRNEFLVVYGVLPGLTAPTGPYVARRIVPPGSGTSSGELILSQADTPNNPDVAYNERSNTYLVTWNERGVPYGQLLNQFGNLVGSRFRLTALLPSIRALDAPAVAAATTSNNFLVSFQEEAAGDRHLVGSFINGITGMTASEVTVSSSPAGSIDQQNSASAYNQNRRQFMVVWERQECGECESFDILGKCVPAP
jgi:hypothetical protein